MFVCSVCGTKSQKWLGQCTDCKSWNSFEEHQEISKKSRASNSRTLGNGDASRHQAHALHSIIPKDDTRVSSGFNEFDRVLGGGMLRSSVILLGGEPGIGKSTLLLQTSAHISKLSHNAQESSVLYVCTEESKDQVAHRAKRLGIEQSHILITQENRVEHIETLIQEHSPMCVIIDSIQAMRSGDLQHNSGHISHIRSCASYCCEWSLQYKVIVIIVAHITKEGIIAGPKLIEHMVDTVLMFEKSKHNIRFLYAQKNRHGAVDEIGMLHMTPEGLKDMSNIGLFFLEDRKDSLPPGVCVAATFEGTRPFLVELQALTVPAIGNNRVYSDRIDPRQISRVSAVLERHLRIPFSGQNIYINVAGGIRISEPGLELGLALALYSAYKDVSMPLKMGAIGELSLPGEVHSVDNFSQRCRQAQDYGFTHLLVPHHNLKDISTSSFKIKIIPVRTISEAVQSTKDLR